MTAPPHHDPNHDPHHDPNHDGTGRLLRAALIDHRETVMTTVDTEHALRRFQSTLDSTRRRRTGGLAVAAAVALLASGVGYAVLQDDDGPPVQAAVAAPRDLRDGEVLGTTDLPGNGRPGAVEVLGDDVVVLTSTGLAFLDPGTGELRRTTAAVPGELFGPLVEAGGGLWAAYAADGRDGYARLDPQSGRVTAFVDTGRAYYLAGGGAGLWAVAQGEDVVRLDPVTGEELARVTLPVRPYGVFVGDDAVWAQAALTGALLRIDPESLAVTPGPELGGAAPGAVVGDELWVPDPTTAEVVRVAMSSGEVVGRTRLPGVEPGGPRDTALMTAAAGDDVYVTSARDGQRLLLRLDTRGTVRDAVRLPDGALPHLVDGSDEAVWLATTGTSEVQRLQVPRR